MKTLDKVRNVLGREWSVMKLKTSKAYIPIWLVALIIYLYMGFDVFFNDYGPTDTRYFMLCICGLGFLQIAMCCISMYRTIQLSQSGVTISIFRWIKVKFYPWDSIEMYYESYETNGNLLGRFYYKGALVLSPRNLKKPKRIPAGTYCAIFHPFSFAYVNFYEDRMAGGAPEFEVKREDFISKMAEFGVPVPDLSQVGKR